MFDTRPPVIDTFEIGIKERSFSLGPILLCPLTITHYGAPWNIDKLVTLL